MALYNSWPLGRCQNSRPILPLLQTINNSKYVKRLSTNKHVLRLKYLITKKISFVTKGLQNDNNIQIVKLHCKTNILTILRKCMSRSFSFNLLEREMNQHYSSQPLCKVIAQRPPRPSQLRTPNLIGALKRGWNKDKC